MISQRVYGLRHEQTLDVARLTGRNVLALREELLLYWLADSEMKFVFGHFPVPKPVLEHFSESWSLITLIQEPVARWFSDFFYVKYRPDVPPGEEIHESLEKFLDTPRARAYGHNFIQYFA